MHMYFLSKLSQQLTEKAGQGEKANLAVDINMNIPLRTPL